jgi:uncharacterized membrane protein (DUF106 family)
MVNEERLRHMVKMARFDDGVGKECRPMIQYARKDYVELELLVSFVAGTVCFGVLAGTWCLYSMDNLMERIARMEIIPIATTFVALYLVFMAAYLTATFVVFQKKYTWGRRQVKKYYGSLKKVNQIYERDEHLKRSGDETVR